MGSAYTSFMPARPSPLSASFRGWCNDLLAIRLANCPVARSSSRYVDATGGNDLNDGLTTATPWRNLSRVRTYLATNPTNVAIYFKRGEIWRDPVGLDITSANVTLAAYGETSTEKPIFSAFNGTVAMDESSYDAGTGVYSFNVGTGCKWVMLSTDRFKAYMRMSAPLTGATAAGTWYHSGSTLQIKPYTSHAETFADTDSQAVVEYLGADNTDSGVYIENVDGCRVHELAAYGYGMRTADPITQEMPFTTKVAGTNESVISECDGYYSGSHAIAFYSASTGGIATFYRCRAGYCYYNGVNGETIFNAYALNSTTHEVIFADCTTDYGTLPDDRWVTSDYILRGVSVYAHGGGIPSLQLVLRHTTAANAFGAQTPATLDGYQSAETNIANINTLIVDEVFAYNPKSGVNFASNDSGAVRINGRYFLSPIANGTEAISIMPANYFRSWWLNCIIDIDCQYLGSAPLALTNEYPGGNTTNLLLQGCHLNYRNTATAAYVLTHDGWQANSPVDWKHYVFNSIVTRQSGTGYVAACNGNTTSTLKNNALFGLYQLGPTAIEWGNDAGKVYLGSAWTVGAFPTTSSPIYRAGTGTGTLALEYDAAYRARITATPSIGPYEAIPVGRQIPQQAFGFKFGF